MAASTERSCLEGVARRGVWPRSRMRMVIMMMMMWWWGFPDLWQWQGSSLRRSQADDDGRECKGGARRPSMSNEQ